MFNCYTCSKTQMCCILLECKQSVKIIAALTSFRHEPSIIIKKEDKSTTVVNQNRANYVADGLRHLNDGIHYAKILNVKTQYIQSLVSKVVNKMYINSNID